jgi:hypothetical protein
MYANNAFIGVRSVQKGVDPILGHEVPSNLSRSRFDNSELLPGVVFSFDYTFLIFSLRLYQPSHGFYRRRQLRLPEL